MHVNPRGIIESHSHIYVLSCYPETKVVEVQTIKENQRFNI